MLPAGEGHATRTLHAPSNRVCRGLAAAAGLSRITFHDLPHSQATGVLKAGTSPTVIAERIGHAKVGFFLQAYAHVLRNDDRDAAEQAAAFLMGNVGRLTRG
jgi:integrase